MATPMKRRVVALAAAGALGLTASCQEFLDVNTNPNAPETVAANLYLSPMLHWMVAGQHWDGRYTSQYTQQLTETTRSTWDMMGPPLAPSDAGGQQWRDVYWSFGQNLIDMMDIARAEERWDILGLGYVLKAWGWQQLTTMHGEIIVSEAFKQGTFSFGYDDQEFVYEEVRKLLDSAIVYLNRTDGVVNASYMARGDKIYNGDRLKWLKFAHGLYAINLSHYTNKASLYDPAAVISHVDQSLASNADDALLSFPATQNDDINFLGPSRGNFTFHRQTQFVVGLMDGTAFGVQDPRMSRMLAPAPDGAYRGLDPDLANDLTALPVSQRPHNPYGYPSTPPADARGIYLFANKARMPAITYAQLQFIKAEAAYRAGLRQIALDAYRAGISAHIDFVNERNREDNQQVTQITAAEKTAFLSNPAIVPTDPNALTLQMIMSQKYIAQWAWAFNELWMDMRRYHYTDVDPVTGERIYPGFELPPVLHSRNAGKPVYRMLPRYNSEYVWNQAGLDEIGGLAEDYHTKMLWIVDPAAQP
jgi:hypothetical protein